MYCRFPVLLRRTFGIFIVRKAVYRRVLFGIVMKHYERRCEAFFSFFLFSFFLFLVLFVEEFSGSSFFFFLSVAVIGEQHVFYSICTDA